MKKNRKDLIDKLGFIGLGSIGLPIAANLTKAGFKLKVHTRSREAENDIRLKGTKSCSSPKEAAHDSSVLIICVSDGNAVDEVIFGEEGASTSLSKGSIIIDLSTISPSKSRLISSKLANKEIKYIDAPVTGGTEGAINGDLTIFIGTNRQIFSKVEHILDVIGSKLFIFDDVGKGQEVKAINQILVAGSYASVAEAISLGESLDLPMKKVIEALSGGAASSWALSNRSTSMLENNYPLGFKLQLHHKDLSIALRIAEQSRLRLPLCQTILELEEELIKDGYKNEDLAVLKRSIIKSVKIK